ncbi:MAG: TonB-dependent receptor [Acidimicrobiia bacterium]|nr:TonB-dependent receptor [Acidimicrobiia bacterium]
MRHVTRWLTVLVCLLAWPASALHAQGVTTGSINGLVNDAQQRPIAGANVVAIHEPSGTVYEGATRADGRFSIPGMRVGGPYSVTVAYVGGSGTAFEPQTKTDVVVNLGVATDVNFAVTAITLQESITVTAQIDPVFSSQRTGAATSVPRAELAALPTISGRITDMTRLTPQASGSFFGGQDDRLNNMTVDGSYFNNSFGIGNQPGDRTNVAAISLESIEQVQVNIAPFDVRQGNFTGASVNTITRSGTNEFTGSVYHRFRNDGFVGTEAKGQTVNPGEFTFRDTGLWAGGPVVRNRIFVFGNYEDEEDSRPLTTFRANRGGETVGGNVTRVLASDLTALSAFLSQNFKYDTGPFENITDLTPAKRYLVRGDYNLSTRHKVSFRYNQLDSSSVSYMSSSSSAGFGRGTFSTAFLSFSGSSYQIFENIKSGIGEWNWVIGSRMSNSLIAGLTSNDESRFDIGGLFPFVEILAPDGTAYTAFGSEPFTPQNQLRYKTFQIKDDFTLFGNNHSFTFGGTLQRYHSDNVFWSCCPQGDFVYSSLADFYADANAYLANPNRTTSAVTLRRYKLRYSNFPGLDEPLQPLTVWFGGGYAQDEWRPTRNLTVTAGVRVDVPYFENTAYANAKADALTFRDQDGSPVQYATGEMPDAKLLWSPRVGFNWDLFSDQRTQLRGGTGVFTGPPPYVWISNQLGNTGVLIGEILVDNTTAFPFSPDTKRYWPSNVTGQGANSFELNVTDPDFKFPQVWRTNVAVDHRLPGGFIGTVEYVYSQDVNGSSYINANLPAAQTAFTGVDNRPRWTANRINNTSPNVITSAHVLGNQSIGSAWNFSTSVSKRLWHGLSLKSAYSYGEARNTIDPGSTAFSTVANNQHAADPNNPGLGWSKSMQGHRVFVQTSYTREYFGFGATTIAAFWEGQPSLQGSSRNASYVFAGDMNGDGYAGNDLIYIPANTSEMNFVQFTAGGVTYTPAMQAEAFEAYIQQDEYLRANRGRYAERGGVMLPWVKRMDLSLTQDVFRNIGGKRNAGQFRIDITNFGNMLNSNWGVSQRMVAPVTAANGAQILTNATADAQGRAAYRLAVVGGRLIDKSFQTQTSLSDVYQFMISFRYSFN